MRSTPTSERACREAGRSRRHAPGLRAPGRPTSAGSAVMGIRGIHYDVGTETLIGGLTRPELSQDDVEVDMAVIAEELRANAVRLSGHDPRRIAMAARVAMNHG